MVITYKWVSENLLEINQSEGDFHDLLMCLKVMFFSVLMCSEEINPKFLEALAPKTGGVKSWKYVSSSSSSTNLIFIINIFDPIIVIASWHSAMFNLTVSPNRLKALWSYKVLGLYLKKGGFCLFVCMSWKPGSRILLFSCARGWYMARRYRSSASVTWLQRLKEGQERQRSRGAKGLQLEFWLPRPEE